MSGYFPRLMTPPIPLRKRLHRRTAIVTRWLHIYLSMLSFAVIFFFAITGLTLNHPAWFEHQQHTSQRHGTLDPATLRAEPDRLRLAELLRTREHLRGTITDFRVEDGQIQLSARAPGYTADLFLDRATGKYDLTEVSVGLVGLLNELHKGHDAGRAWGWVIDASAILLTLVSLTGLILIWFIYKRRTAGLLLAFLAAVAVVAIYRWLIP